MGSLGVNDVAQGNFWLFNAFAVFLLALAVKPSHHKTIFSLVNLSLICMLTSWQGCLLVASMCAALHFSCQTRNTKLRYFWIFLAGVLLLSTFMVHKLPVVPSLFSESIKPILYAIGASYIFLRGVEYLRAGADDEINGSTLFETINYLIPFHMLAAGPVMAYSDYKRTLNARVSLTKEDALVAFELIASGLFRKFVLANGVIQSVFLTGFQSDGWYFFLEVQMYYLFIYLDFSAYTNIALGIGKLIGVPTPINFNKPLSARNIVIFWERWHISLSQFIRRNIFIPIQLSGLRWTGGSNSALVASVALTVSFLLCGLWHAFSWHFVVWGAAHACAIMTCITYRSVLESKLGRKQAGNFSQRPLVKLLATLLTFEFVAFSLAFLAIPL